MMNLPQYRSSKNVVGALQIAQVDRMGRTKIRFLLESVPMRHELVDFGDDFEGIPDVRTGDYLMELEDGSVQWSAPEPFERDFERLAVEPEHHEFDELRRELKKGEESPVAKDGFMDRALEKLHGTPKDHGKGHHK